MKNCSFATERPSRFVSMLCEGFRRRAGLTVFFWIVAVSVLVVLVCTTHSPAWDAKVYWKAIHLLRQGEDPYAVGVSAQRAFYAVAQLKGAERPFTYMYPPMTLSLLHLFKALPDRWMIGLYWAAAMVGTLLMLWVGYRMASEEERPWLAMMLPLSIFFPGLLNQDTILSGNIAYIIYGVAWVAAYRGWSRQRWLCFYLVVLAASIFKPPVLTLLALPVLLGRRQWFTAGMTGAAGLAMFSVQGYLWPELFREYLGTLHLQFHWNDEFGAGPAGVLGKTLRDVGKPYLQSSMILPSGVCRSGWIRSAISGT
jgi:hypothetical protein